MERPSWATDDVDLEHPSAARVYDYYLGGSHNFTVDRRMARRAIELWPDLPELMQANRAFLRRSVRYLVGQGITQLLDIGSGIPTRGNVHEVAQAAAPELRVVYDPRAKRLIDPTQPLGVLMVAILYFVPDEADPAGIVAAYRARMPPGSYLAVSHASYEGQPDLVGSHTEFYQRTATPMTMRSRREIKALLGGFDLAPPGVVFLPLWRPDSPVEIDDHPERFTGYAVVGRRQ